MYETYPKFSLGFVAVMLVAAFVLPAVMTFPSVGQTATGVQIALMLLVLWVIRLILLPDQTSWLDAARFPLALFAAVAALNFSPQDGVMDVVTNYNFVPMLVGAAIGIALLSRRPKTLGFSVNRQYWSVLVAAMWAMVVIRSTISEGQESLLDFFRLAITFILTAAVVDWHPKDSVVDVLSNAALTALIIPAYLVMIWAFPNQRPAQMGLRFGGAFWVCVVGLLGLSLWNFAYDMRENWGLALINTLSLAVFFLNAALPISAAKIPFRENWRTRLMAATSFPLGLYAAFAWPKIVLSQETPMAALIAAALLTLALFTLSPWLERRLQPK